MTKDQELKATWFCLTDTYQEINRTTNEAERKRLIAFADVCRCEYRHLTSIYYS